MGNKKSPRNFNGKIVSFDKEELKKFPIYTCPGNYYIGISFATPSDVNESLLSYVHVLATNKKANRIYFYRFPVSSLNFKSTKVSKKLKDKTEKMVKSYFKLGYLDNLSYMETLANLKRIKTR